MHKQINQETFITTITTWYKNNRRSFIWREHITPYHVVVSEIMLQQTQTERVAQKFPLFIAAFPDFITLANASFSDVLREWKGLGYNRRAQALCKIATNVVNNFDGQLPHDPEILKTFPGIGPATASSIAAFAFNKPTFFIETNIRTVFIHFFFKNEHKITDKQIMPLVQATLNKEHPREWYYALMDYGVMLKKEIGNLNKQSAHYTKQSKFIGSNRQIRGKILQILLDQPGASLHTILTELQEEPSRVTRILITLEKEHFIKNHHDGWWLNSKS